MEKKESAEWLRTGLILTDDMYSYNKSTSILNRGSLSCRDWFSAGVRWIPSACIVEREFDNYKVFWSEFQKFCKETVIKKFESSGGEAATSEHSNRWYPRKVWGVWVSLHRFIHKIWLYILLSTSITIPAYTLQTSRLFVPSLRTDFVSCSVS